MTVAFIASTPDRFTSIRTAPAGACITVFVGMVAAALLTGVAAVAQEPTNDPDQNAYQQCVCVAAPELYWDFSSGEFTSVLGELRPAAVRGTPEIAAVGPSSPEFPLFSNRNMAVRLNGSSLITYDDPGDNSLLDYSAGDTISIEAWVRIDSISEGQQVYVVGKGRTQNPGQAKDNQNYGLRLRGLSGMAHVSFLYRSADRVAVLDTDGKLTSEAYQGEFHRWNSHLGFEPDGLWHHVAVSYTFGSAQPPRAWIDGLSSDGSWDMGAKTFANPPLVDNDQLWIGSSMGGSANASFRGAIDELAIFRRALSDREIQERFQTTRATSAIAELANDQLPADSVTLDVREAVRLTDPWSREGTRITMQWQQPFAAVSAVPKKYISGGIIGDRTNPYVLRMRCRVTTPAVTTWFVIRSRSNARLLVDGQEVISLQQAKYASDGHEAVRDAKPLLHPQMHPLPAGDQEAAAEFSLSAGEHLIEFETVVGGKGMRVENSESLIAIGSPENGFHLLSPGSTVFPSNPESVRLDERSWRQFAEGQRRFVLQVEQEERARQDIATSAWWQRRHETARRLIGLSESLSGSVSSSIDSAGIDRLLLDVIKAEQLSPLNPVDDLTFLRRLTLNTVGVIPSKSEIDWFLNQDAEDRRKLAVERFLSDSRWADHWVSYWQDVLAENPGILKPELNNSGPFRWWIYESFLDNKPTDRFATELVMMRGSRLGGGPAGFAMASQNDVPFAERALVLSTAFNAREMKCARCHDSPVNEVSQQQLFELAAMINRGPLKLPATSTVPLGPNGERSSLITVSLDPGAVIEPVWPFRNSEQQRAPEWSELLQNPSDTREQAALHLTHPVESEFAPVIVNRLWTRLFGTGLRPSPDDWNGEAIRHAELLQALSEQHIASGYDLKSTARLILNTQAFQRETAPLDSPITQLFGAQSIRRTTAEQMVDSLYSAVGKQFDAEMLTLDQEGRRPESSFLNLGRPIRAWQFCGLSNERDRPALALPMAQSILDLLSVFGWRDARPHTLSEREQEATVLQPLTLANGTAGRRLIQLSDGAIATELAVAARTPEELAEQLFQHTLTRPPSADELSAFAAELSEGFENRLIPGAKVPEQPVVLWNPVSWSNHLHPRATEIKQEIEAAVRAGDPPSVRLTSEWRTRAEDVLWVLLNSPEFAFVP